LDVLAGKELDCPELRAISSLNFLTMYGDQRARVGLRTKLLRYLLSYGRLLCYAATARPRIFHVLWNNKFQLFDRTILMLYYRLLGKKIAFTAHNVNAAERDGNESFVNRWTLQVQYRLVHHIFVHTDKMKDELCKEFRVAQKNVSVIPFGINNSVPDTNLSSIDAKQTVGVGHSDKTILFFGRIRPYKGLDYLVEAFRRLALQDQTYRLIVAGEPKKESLQGIPPVLAGGSADD
jgi:glycosyltransferase involved in cell wall biosynthesis